MTDVGSNYRYCAPGSRAPSTFRVNSPFDGERERERNNETERARLSTLAMLLMHKIIAILLHEKIYDIEFLRLRHPSSLPLLISPLAYEQYTAVQLCTGLCEASVIAHTCVVRVYTSATFLM